jgi:hypothetical protein
MSVVSGLELNEISPARVGEFFSFINKRESIRVRRAQGEPFPWTQDPILQQYKFTNVFRTDDKTTRVLNSTFYQNQGRIASDRDCLMNCATFRYFGLAETALEIGWTDGWFATSVWARAHARARRGEKVFTGAYVVTNGGIKGPKIDVVCDYLSALAENSANIIDAIRTDYSWEGVSALMAKLPGFGGTGFMAKEVLLDTFFTRLWEHEGRSGPDDYGTWTPVGPGGRRGAARILQMDGGQSISLQKAQTIIKYLTDYQRYSWEYPQRKLVPHDIQFQLCEFDKYLRVALGEGRPRALYRPSETSQ